MPDHEKKLQEYILNPYSCDNKGLLKNAISKEIKNNIIIQRVNILKKQIEGHKKELVKIMKAFEKLKK